MHGASERVGEAGELGYGAWILFWAELIVLAAVAVLGAF